MGFAEKYLSDDEQVIYHLRTHAKALILPVVVLLLLAAGIGFGLGALPDDETIGTVGRWAILVVGVVVLIGWVVWPFLAWLTTTYTVTSERLLTRRGILTRTGRDIPLRVINDVAHERNLNDRILRCGTLVVSAASEQGQVRLRDVPRVYEVKLRLSELVREAHDEDERQ
ncbi:PH (Pleckstrin Homology) domain-containing protein [Haloactinopolyspora alba]|uniref:PH (Pleckstrin Homology) domain-containing protein n=1 Tax=Haloactinopolyspora alba TaxID=648780 RepID=A0A2P8E111_9ACTN|nr:PH domain-containing protein [Haloactinopolyspora alba]PSL03171.1 PH (Pleckstrin Homology) domain-containing protein [Haloactinopolyspora alba]